MMKHLTSGRIWLVYGVVCLLLAGFLTTPMLLGKVAFVRDLLPGIDWVRRSLVIHVILATIIWHTVVPIALLYLSGMPSNYKKASLTELTGLLLTVVGVLLLFSTLPNKASEPILANYIPVLTTKSYYMGLILIFAGLTLALLHASKNLLFRKPLEASQGDVRETIYFLRPMLLLGALYFFLGIFTLLQALNAGSGFIQLGHTDYFELVMWGAGHLLQHSSAVFVVVCWELLFRRSTGQIVLNSQKQHVLIILFVLPLVFLPNILLSPLDSQEYRHGFTWLMRWGIFPSLSLYIIFLVTELIKHGVKKTQLLSGYSGPALIGSILLLVTGMIFGAFIEGSDLRIPGHYHASIGAITVAFMALCIVFSVDKQLTEQQQPWMRSCILVFVAGQLLFSGAMFAAGCFGVERKTYGSGIVIETAAQKFSFAILGLGGTIAFLGGFLFFLAYLTILFNYRSKQRY